MKVISFDIGIKNLSFCLMEMDDTVKILKWDNINLTQTKPLVCSCKNKNNVECLSTVKYKYKNNHYCLKHAKQLTYFKMSTELTCPFIKKQKKTDIPILCNKYNIPINNEHTDSKQIIISNIIKYYNEHLITPVKLTNASKLDLVFIGKNMQFHLDNILKEDLNDINMIIIENQIGPLANKMKTIQGMLAQYFIMRNKNNICIDFINATNKLKDFIPHNEKLKYKDRKSLSISATNSTLQTLNNTNNWETFFNTHKKKDDLADCFLQGLWFFKYKYKNI